MYFEFCIVNVCGELSISILGSTILLTTLYLFTTYFLLNSPQPRIFLKCLNMSLDLLAEINIF